MDCVCHGSPAYWNKDPRSPSGGYPRCAVRKRREQNAIDAARSEAKNQRARDRYDRDPIHRISKRLHDDARERAANLKRKKEAHHRPLPDQG